MRSLRPSSLNVVLTAPMRVGPDEACAMPIATSQAAIVQWPSFMLICSQERQGSSSFLKKRTKKLLSVSGSVRLTGWRACWVN
jgi:hypothetical protein